MKLTLYQFNVLPPQKKFDLVWNEGTYLCNRFEQGHRYNLYALNNFFIEVAYDVGEEKITGLRTFCSSKALENYMPFIEIEKIWL